MDCAGLTEVLVDLDLSLKSSGLPMKQVISKATTPPKPTIVYQKNDKLNEKTSMETTKVPTIPTIRGEVLAVAISDLIEEFGLIHSKPKTGKARKIVRIIINTMTEALQKGESIKIDGFGTLEVYTRLPRKKSVSYFEGGPKNRQRSLHSPPRGIVTIPLKRIVKFTPSKTILRILNKKDQLTSPTIKHDPK